MKQFQLPDRGQWVAVFFFICFAWIAYQTFLLAEPFLPGLLGAVMLGLIFFPLYGKVLKRVQNPNTAALLMTIGIILITVLPMIFMAKMALDEAEILRPTLAAFIENYRTPSYIQGLLDPLLRFFEGFHIELKPFLLDKASKIGARMSSE